MINLVVGDVHAVPEELGDCEALVELVAEVAYRCQPDAITWMGDQHNNHDTVSARVMAFWRSTFTTLKNYRNVVLVGNHDQANPRDRFPHALLAYKDMPNVDVVEEPRHLGGGVCAMPFYYDPAEFLQAATALKEANPDASVLFCHQTFVGADGSFYAKDECSALAVPFKTVVGGHIHTPQVVDKKVLYVGAPRWRSKDDAGKDRFIYVMDHQPGKLKVLKKVSTDSHCRRIWLFDDRPEAPAPLETIPAEKRKLASIRVDVFGPAAHVRTRCEELRAAGCRARPVPDRAKASVVSEREGVDTAFSRYFGSFVPPYGTPTDTLRGMLETRLEK